MTWNFLKQLKRHLYLCKMQYHLNQNGWSAHLLEQEVLVWIFGRGGGGSVNLAGKLQARNVDKHLQSMIRKPHSEIGLQGVKAISVKGGEECQNIFLRRWKIVSRRKMERKRQIRDGWGKLKHKGGGQKDDIIEKRISCLPSERPIFFKLEPTTTPIANIFPC